MASEDDILRAHILFSFKFKFSFRFVDGSKSFGGVKVLKGLAWQLTEFAKNLTEMSGHGILQSNPGDLNFMHGSIYSFTNEKI